MLNKLKKFAREHKNNFFIKTIYSVKHLLNSISSPFKDYAAIKRIKKVVQKSKITDAASNIRILFIVIDPNTWNKSKAVYEEMLKEDKIDLSMVCVPSINDVDKNTTYEFFSSLGYNCIDAKLKNGDWFDIQTLKPHYIFYTEPYNNYLPDKYKSFITASYAKICIVTYGMTIAREFLKIRPRDFYRDVYICYANNKDELSYNINQFKRNHKRKLQFTKFFGFVAFEELENSKMLSSRSWDFSRNNFRVIWTPRWTLDSKTGGSNFFKYKDFLIDFAKKNKYMDFLFRPHPMALKNFVQNGLMTQKEVLEFQNICLNENNLNLDDEKDYSSTFWGSDVLISDVSSIVVEYFFTGKPIIFCKNKDVSMQFLPFFQKILEVCYVVENIDELDSVVRKLYAGEDCLKDKRKIAFQEIFGENATDVARSIVNDIINDFA